MIRQSYWAHEPVLIFKTSTYGSLVKSLITLYDAEGWMPVNKYNAYSFNNVTAKKADDGSITIHFGGDPKADNFLPIEKGWNYIVRLYRPKKEILDGSWKFPGPEPVE